MKRREPYLIRLPKGCVSPSGRNLRYDIKMQTRVLSMYEDSPNVVRSTAPFTIIVDVAGRIKYLDSVAPKGPDKQ